MASSASADAVNPKLTVLREQLAKADGGAGVAAFIIPTEDPHMGEYPPACDERRVFITGFTGSAGTAVVTADQALLWTDGRYFLQAEAQLEAGWKLMKQGTAGCPEIEDWLTENLPEGAAVGYDPWLHTVSSVQRLESALASGGQRAVPLPSNPVDAVWGEARPAPPQGKLRVHDARWAGREAALKLADLRRAMADARATAVLIAATDEVAWLLNVRGADVAHNPVCVAYTLVTPGDAVLFVDESKVTADVAEHLSQAGVSVKPYDTVGDALAAAAAAAAADRHRVWIDPAKVNAALKQRAVDALAGIGSPAPEADGRGSARKRRAGAAETIQLPADPAVVRRTFLEKATPVTEAKAIKNEAELEGMREAHMRDAVALIGFLCWLEQQLAEGKTFTEVEIDKHLTARRAAQPGYIDTSFDTIAGAGPNGAIIHYRAEPATARTVDAATHLLLDSGGQYDCGTTDITRTMHFGEPSEHVRRCFTAVLKGHIALDTVIVPEGTPGCAVDGMARAALWRMGLNYRHGTGHGVGAALNVHEGPQSISARYYITAGLRQGMVCSNEPGYYEDGAFGIRIENLFYFEKAPTPFNFGGDAYLRPKAITLVPFQHKMIMVEDLTQEEVQWVDDYHKRVLAEVGPRLEGKELDWLKRATEPINTAALA